MKHEELVSIVQNAGAAGCGGAGFPAYAKLDSRADTVILNCAECEPLFKAHRQVLEKYAYEICTALDIITKALCAEQFIVAVKGEYTGAAEAIGAVISQFENGKLSLLPNIYPAGDEVITIYETTGRVVPAGNIPISVGAVVFNVETVYNIYRAVVSGAPVTHKYVTVAGEVKTPQTLYVPIGTSFEHLIALCGGRTRTDVSLLNGGPMTGVPASGFDVVKKNTNGILVLPSDNPVILKRQAKTQTSVLRAKSSCCQCRMCTDLCPRNLLGQPVEPNEFMKAVLSGRPDNTGALINTMYCVSCGLCEMYACTQGLNPRSLIANFKADMIKSGVKPSARKAPGDVSAQREYRRVPMSRLIERLGLVRYNTPAPLADTAVEVRRVKVLLSQHIGVPASAAVKKGDTVLAGDVIGKAAENALSLPVHSPVNGTVIEANDAFVLVDAD